MFHNNSAHPAILRVQGAFKLLGCRQTPITFPVKGGPFRVYFLHGSTWWVVGVTAAFSLEQEISEKGRSSWVMIQRFSEPAANIGSNEL